MNKIWLMVGILALGALGLAFMFTNQTGTAKTVTLEPSTVIKGVKPNSSVRPAGSLEDLTKNAPEPRAVTTDAIIVPPKPEPAVSSTPEVVGAKPEVTTPTPVAVSETSSQVTKPVPEISKSIEKPQVSSSAQMPRVSTEPSSATTQESVTTQTTSSVPAASLPLRRRPGSISIQAGAFKNADNAEALRVQLISQGFNTSVDLGEDGILRVIVGPYPNEQSAQDAARKISSR